MGEPIPTELMVESYRAMKHKAITGQWKAVVPRWLYNRFVEQSGEDVVSRLFEPVDDWSVDDATF